MSTRNKFNSRYSRFQRKAEEDIIEIKEPINSKKSKGQNLRRRDIIEFTSSEATTPNKQEKKSVKKKKDNDIVVLDLSGNNSKINNKRKKSFDLRNKRANSNSRVLRERENKNKKVVKSVNKIKSFIKNKKTKKTPAIIPLEESDDEIQVTTTKEYNKSLGKNQNKIKSKKHLTKTPLNKSHGKRIRRHILTLPKRKTSLNKNKKSVKSKNNNITQYELLSSEESEIEEIPNKKKTVTSQSKKKFENKAKAKTFLGKKRNNEKILKSKTPNKQRRSPSQTLNKKPIEINISSSPIKIRSGSSKTPVKSNSKKVRNILPINLSTINKSSSPSEIAIVGKLNKLVKEFGFEKVLDAICKSKLNQKNKLENLIQGIKDTLNNEKLPLFLIRMLFTYFNDKIENKDVIANIHIAEDKEKSKKKDNKDSKEKNKALITVLKSLSTDNTNNNGDLNEIAEKLISKSPTKSSTYSKNNNKKNNIEVVPMELDDQVVNAIHLTEDEPGDKVQSQKKEKKNIVPNPQTRKKIEKEKNEKSPIKIQNEEPKKEKKNMSIGSHYHKDEEGHVYKYQVCKLDGQGNAIFKCYDDKCSGEGMYDLDTRIFKVSKKHNLKHEEHDYIISYDKSEDNIFKEMKNMNKNDAQVFKEANVRTVKIY